MLPLKAALVPARPVPPAAAKRRRSGTLASAPLQAEAQPAAPAAPEEDDSDLGPALAGVDLQTASSRLRPCGSEQPAGGCQQQEQAAIDDLFDDCPPANAKRAARRPGAKAAGKAAGKAAATPAAKPGEQQEHQQQQQQPAQAKAAAGEAAAPPQPAQQLPPQPAPAARQGRGQAAAPEVPPAQPAPAAPLQRVPSDPRPAAMRQRQAQQEAEDAAAVAPAASSGSGSRGGTSAVVEPQAAATATCIKQEPQEWGAPPPPKAHRQSGHGQAPACQPAGGRPSQQLDSGSSAGRAPASPALQPAGNGSLGRSPLQLQGSGIFAPAASLPQGSTGSGGRSAPLLPAYDPRRPVHVVQQPQQAQQAPQGRQAGASSAHGQPSAGGQGRGRHALPQAQEQAAYDAYNISRTMLTYTAACQLVPLEQELQREWAAGGLAWHASAPLSCTSSLAVASCAQMPTCWDAHLQRPGCLPCRHWLPTQPAARPVCAV